MDGNQASLLPTVDGLENQSDWVSIVVAKDPDGSMQERSVSTDSPGPVRSEEVVARLVMSPLHFDQSLNQPLEALFDDAFSIGASTIRLSYAGESEPHDRGLQKQADARAGSATKAPRDHTYLGFARLLVNAVRTQASDGLARVYDTARIGFHCHADIVVDARNMPGKNKTDKLARKRIKILLVQHAFLEMGGIIPCPI